MDPPCLCTQINLVTSNRINNSPLDISDSKPVLRILVCVDSRKICGKPEFCGFTSLSSLYLRVTTTHSCMSNCQKDIKGPEQEDQASDHHHPFFIIKTHHDVKSFTAGCDAQNWSHHQEPIPYCTRSDHMCGVLQALTVDSDSYPQVPEIENAGNSFRSVISERKAPSSDMLLPLFGCSGRACFIQVAPSRRVALGLGWRIRVLTNFQVYPCVWVPSGKLT